MNVLAMIGLWSHLLAATLAGALALWLVRPRPGLVAPVAMAFACAVTAGWSLAVAQSGPGSPVALAGEALRNLAWLAYMFAIWRTAQGDERPVTVTAIYGIAAVVFALAGVLDALPLWATMPEAFAGPIFATGQLLRMMGFVAALVLLHNLYSAATPDARNAIRLQMTGLAVMWLYTLNVSASAYLGGAAYGELTSLLGVVLAAVITLFGLGTMQRKQASLRLSRAATFQSLGLAAILGYLGLIVLVASALDAIAPAESRTAQIAFFFGISVAAILLLPSARFRAWFRVKIAKHLFQHRYDYRTEWTRFTNTIGRANDDATALEERIIQAIADILESPGGVLLVNDDRAGLTLQSHWRWADLAVPSVAAEEDLARYCAATGRIIEIDALRLRSDESDAESRAVPQWMIAQGDAWVIVPLLHFDRLAGVILLMRPALARSLDWEDFDLLRVVGRQVASYLAEARGQEMLSDVQQFDEFNRRFAFIMHDIKNLVSQLSLMTRNAEKHAGNPEFQADMIATLRNSTDRMNDLLARLSQHNKARASEADTICIGPIIERIAAAKRNAHPVVIGGDLDAYVSADPVRLEQALSQLVQNGIDASDPTEPVSILTHLRNGEAVIVIEDKGCGMSSHFIRHQLFKPFASTKETGFGIGAYEARALIIAMGGRIEVQSREGEGSRFLVTIPLARESAAFLDDPKAMVA